MSVARTTPLEMVPRHSMPTAPRQNRGSMIDTFHQDRQICPFILEYDISSLGKDYRPINLLRFKQLF